MSYPILLAIMGALFVLLAWASSWLSSLVAELLRSGRRSPASTLMAGALLAPVVLAALAVAAVLVPNLLSGCHCPAHGDHHSHLCLVHPSFAHPLVGPALAVLALWGLLAWPGLKQLARELIVTRRIVRAARLLPVRHIAGVAVRVVDWGTRSAFTAGVLSPVIVLDRELVESLDDAALQAIVLHEQAHVSRRDGLTLVALRLMRALWPAFGLTRAIERWHATVERQCDEHAATELGDPTQVAAALLAVERLRARPHPPVMVPTQLLGLGIGSARAIESRVTDLLDGAPGRRRAQRLGNDVLAVVIVTAGLGALMISWPGDAVHHAVEHALEVLSLGT